MNSLSRGVAALATFVILAVLVALGVLDRFDRAVLNIVQVPHASWLDLGASLISVVGQTEVVGTVALAVAIARLRARRRDWWMPLLILVARFPDRTAIGTSLAAIGITALAGTIRYAFAGDVEVAYAALVGIPAAFGAVAGASLQQRLNRDVLRFAFAALLVVVALLLLFT